MTTDTTAQVTTLSFAKEISCIKISISLCFLTMSREAETAMSLDTFL